MNHMSFRDSFKKGTVELMVLALLADSDLYGYQFSQLILSRSGGAITVPEGSLYPMLYRLVDDGFISCTRVPSGRRRILIYYHIEPSGLARLKEMLEEYKIFSNGMQSFLQDCRISAQEEDNNE